jgi:DnaK suppressor protein
MSTTTEPVRQRLLAKRRELLRRYRDELQRVEEELAEQQAERVERSTDEWDARVLNALGDTDVRAILAVVEAIRRLDAGTYGSCAVCAYPIGPSRLDAVPEAALCIDCAADREPFARSA